MNLTEICLFIYASLQLKGRETQEEKDCPLTGLYPILGQSKSGVWNLRWGSGGGEGTPGTQITAVSCCLQRRVLARNESGGRRARTWTSASDTGCEHLTDCFRCCPTPAPFCLFEVCLHVSLQKGATSGCGGAGERNHTAQPCL